jgi:hypothetical protein
MDDLNESTPRAGAAGSEAHEITPDANRSPESLSDAARLTENELEDVVGGVGISRTGTGPATLVGGGTGDQLMKRAPIGGATVVGANGTF